MSDQRLPCRYRDPAPPPGRLPDEPTVLAEALGRTRPVNDLVADNERLRADNARLLDRVARLEEECRRLLGQP